VCVFIRYCLFVVVACQFVCVVSLMVETKRVLLLFSYSFDFGLFQQFTLCVCVLVTCLGVGNWDSCTISIHSHA
jgi:hypothetical protein